MVKKHKNTLIIPLFLLLLILAIGVGFIINLVKSMNDYTIIKEQELTSNDIILSRDIDFGINFVLEYCDISETNNLENYKNNTINYYHMFYRFMNLHSYNIKKYNHEDYAHHLIFEDKYYNVYYNITDKLNGIVVYNDQTINFSYHERNLTLTFNDMAFNFIIEDTIHIEVIKNNSIIYTYDINYDTGSSYCEMEILTLFNTTDMREKYILNKADERLFSHFENETIDYNYIIIKENNEYIFNVNSGGKYD